MKTVLIVEDSAQGRDVYADALEAAGYRVVQAGDGAEGVRVAVENPPDLVLMNLSIPLVTGVDAIEILKGHPATQDVPVIVITGHTSMDIQDAAWRAGCDDFFSKPFAPGKLVAVVREQLGPATES